MLPKQDITTVNSHISQYQYISFSCYKELDILFNSNHLNKLSRANC